MWSTYLDGQQGNQKGGNNFHFRFLALRFAELKEIDLLAVAAAAWVFILRFSYLTSSLFGILIFGPREHLEIILGIQILVTFELWKVV